MVEVEAELGDHIEKSEVEAEEEDVQTKNYNDEADEEVDIVEDEHSAAAVDEGDALELVEVSVESLAEEQEQVGKAVGIAAVPEMDFAGSRIAENAVDDNSDSDTELAAGSTAVEEEHSEESSKSEWLDEEEESAVAENTAY